MPSLPNYPAGTVDWRRIATALLTIDQFDDWLPDPVFYRDRSVPSLSSRLSSLWQSGTLAAPQADRIALPRASGSPLEALALPIDARLCAHAAIANLAPRLAPKLERDKVYGFRFLRTGPQMYDAPGDELNTLFGAVTEAARATSGGSFDVHDVVAFNASAQPQRLASTLQRLGAQSAETDLIRELTGDTTGLPSIDDAFAFIYNFYLQPVDAALAAARKNFFRYRDEYFVFDPDAATTLTGGLSSVGLQARRAGRSVNITQTVDTLNSRLGGSAPRQRANLLALPQGQLTAVVACHRIGQDDCTDHEETISFEEATVSTRLRNAASGRLDAVDMVPVLRTLNKGRASGVLNAPPFRNEPAQLRNYRAGVESSRGDLQTLLASAVTANDTWRIGWTATLLSDAAPLPDVVVQQLLRAVASPQIGETAKVQARLALARSSTVAPERFWTSVTPSTEYTQRTTLVAARHLARRSPAPWNEARTTIGSKHPELVSYLTAGIAVPR